MVAEWAGKKIKVTLGKNNIGSFKGHIIEE